MTDKITWHSQTKPGVTVRGLGAAKRSHEPAGRGRSLAEGVGFEPTMDRKAHTGFRDRRFQPLSHPSVWRERWQP